MAGNSLWKRFWHAVPGGLRKWIFVRWSLVSRAMTLGVRAVVIDDQGRVLLIRHTYVKGWHLPGGGVERGETFDQALRKELLEEADIQQVENPKLFSLYRNLRTSKYDHVALYIVQDWQGSGLIEPNWEIAESGFYSLDALPDDVTDSTKDRLAEVFQDQPIDQYW